MTAMPLKMTERQYVAQVHESLERIGYCHECGEESGGCEPDAENYPCPACGENAVFGLELLLIMGDVEFVD